MPEQTVFPFQSDSWEHYLSTDASAPLVLRRQEYFRSPFGQSPQAPYGWVFPATFAPDKSNTNGPPRYSLFDMPNAGKSEKWYWIDTPQSQARRISRLFLENEAWKGIVPDITITFLASTSKPKDAQSKNSSDAATPQDTLPPVSLLTAGHRIADAVVRLSSLHDKITEALTAFTVHHDALPLLRLSPLSLLFGFWDSREDTHAKHGRLFRATVLAQDGIPWSKASTYVASVPRSLVPSDALKPSKNSSDTKASGVGAANALSYFPDLGGIAVRGGIVREASLNLLGLRQLKTQESETTKHLQRYLLGLGWLALLTTPRDLRSGTILIDDKHRSPTLVALYADGSERTISPHPPEKDVLKMIREEAKALDLPTDAAAPAEFDVARLHQALNQRNDTASTE